MICCDRFFIFLSLATLAQNRTIPRKPPTLLPYERSVGFASLRNSGRSTSSIHARPLSKVRCCRPKEFGRLPEGLPQLHRPSPSPQPLQKGNSTSLRTTTLASLVKGELLLLSFAQPTIEGLPHQTLSFPQPLQKDNNPSPHVCPFTQYVNRSQVCSPAHSSAFGTASPQDRYKAQK